jgi:DNA-binding transcriptional MerR regulator
MNKNVFTREDLLGKAGVSGEALSGWMKAKLVRPAGFAEDKTPLFTAEALDRIAHIRKIEDLGYGIEEIQKIIKKFGLPTGRNDRKVPLKKDPYLTVGGLADRSGVSPRTIKHWEDKGVIEPDMRTEGGFRLYSESYVFLCQLIRDLQLFGYTLEEIKAVSDEVRDFLAIQADLDVFPKPIVDTKLAAMLGKIQDLYGTMKLLKEGVARWEDLLKKKKKDIQCLRNRNQKRQGLDEVSKKGKTDA